jgi:hypothetical protein
MKPLVVFIVYFGELPVWLPLTLQSMSVNPRVDFVVIGDAAAPATVPPNVHFERIGFTAMQLRLSELTTPGNSSGVRYDDTFAGHYNKGNDIKPLAAELYPQLADGHEWWAWSDLDVVFGDLLKWMGQATLNRHAACCRCIPREKDGGRGARKAADECAASGGPPSGSCCQIPLRRSPKSGELEVRNVNMVNVYSHKTFCPCDHGERVNVVSPLYPNPWRKKARAILWRCPMAQANAQMCRSQGHTRVLPCWLSGVGAFHRLPDGLGHVTISEEPAVAVGDRVGRLCTL